MAEEHPQNESAPTAPVRESRPLHRFSTRILGLVVLATILTAGVVSWISVDAIRGELLKQVDTRFRTLVENRGAAIDSYLDSTRVRLGDALARSNRIDRLGAGGPEAEAVLDELLKKHAPFSGIAVVRPNGDMVARAGELSAGAAIALAAASSHPDRVAAPIAFVIGGAHPMLGTWVAGVFTGDDDTGARVVAVHRVEPLQALMQLGPDDGPGSMVLTDRSGHGLVWTSGDTQAPTLPIQALIAAGSGTIGEFEDVRGRRMVASAKPLRAANLHLGVAAPLDLVYAPISSVVERIFLSDLAIVLLVSLLTFRITAAIMRPVEALSEGAARISQGDVHHEIPIPGTNDEIGQLAHSFNDMMHRLRRSQDEIEDDKHRLTEQNEELQRANEVLAQLSITDGLTRLHNHRFFQDHLTREIKRVDRTGEPLSMLLMDLDDFKRLNDRHGHAAGDEVLMNISVRLNENIRESDLLARYGGEEFVVLTPNTDLEGAVALAEKIRMSVESMPQIVDDTMRPIRVTISCGVALYAGDRKQFFQAADRALYRAKAEGKNCVIAATAED